MISRQLYNFVYFLVKDVLKISYNLIWCMNIKQHSTSCQGFFGGFFFLLHFFRGGGISYRYFVLIVRTVNDKRRVRTCLEQPFPNIAIIRQQYTMPCCMVQIKENTQQCKYLLIACPYTCTSIFPLSIWAQGVEFNQELGPDSGKGQCCVLQKNLPPNFKMLVIFKLAHIIDLNTNKTYLYLKNQVTSGCI